MDVTTLLNLTPHPVTLIFLDGSQRTLPPEGAPPRVQLTHEESGVLSTPFGDLPLTRTRLSHTVADLPDRQPGTMLVVARLVAEALPDRDDLVFPDDVKRDSDGQVIGARAVGRPRWPTSPAWPGPAEQGSVGIDRLQ